MKHRKSSFLRKVAIILIASVFCALPAVPAMGMEEVLTGLFLDYFFGDLFEDESYYDDEYYDDWYYDDWYYDDWYYDDGYYDDAYYDENEYGWTEYPSDSEYTIYVDDRTGFLFGLYTDDTAYIEGHVDFAYSSPQRKTDLHIPATVMGVPVYGVGEKAFANTQNIGHVYVEEGVCSIGVGAFEGCSLTGITLPSTLNFIEYDAFCGCPALGNVTLPEGLEFIGSTAFSQCPGLTQVRIPDSVTEIRYDAFFDCANLESVHIGSGLSMMEGNVFSRSSRLKTFTVSDRNRTFRLQDGILYNTVKNSIVRYPGMNRKDTTFTVPNGIVCVEDSCFADNNTLERIILPDSVQTIEDFAFLGCNRCVYFDLGQGVASIGDSVIPTNQLFGIQLPDSLTSIHDLSLFSWPEESFAYDTFWVVASPGSYAADWARQQGYEVYSPTPEALAAIGAQPQHSAIVPGDAESILAAGTMPATVLSGNFDQTEYFVEAGQTIQLAGNVQSSASAIDRITVNVSGYNSGPDGRLMTMAYEGNATSIDLDENSAFCVDTANAPFNLPGTYTLMLWASAADGTTLTTPLATAKLTVMEFSAEFSRKTKTLVLGQKWIPEGTVFVAGSKLGRVSVNSSAVANSTMTDDFTGRTDAVHLQDWAAYTIDTTKEPFNKAGTYTLNVWAKDVNGIGGSRPLAQMTVEVVDRSQGISREAVVSKAYEWANYIWELEEDLTLHKYDGVAKKLTKGTMVRGLPYSYGPNWDTTLDEYKNLNSDKKYGAVDSGSYGADCKTLVYDCFNSICPDIVNDIQIWSHKDEWFDVVPWNEMQPGDVIWRKSGEIDYYGNKITKEGHVGIIVKVHPDGSFDVVDQTVWNGGKKLGQVFDEKTADGKDIYMIGTCIRTWTLSEAWRMNYSGVVRFKYYFD